MKTKKPLKIKGLMVIWWALTGSNRRPSVRQTDALPAELSARECHVMVPATGIEPVTD